MLIVGRAVAGAGASALFSGGMTIVGFTVPLVQRPMFIAALSSMFGVSSVVGPLLGGALTDKVSWRWCFWVSLFPSVWHNALFYNNVRTIRRFSTPHIQIFDRHHFLQLSSQL